MSIAVLCVTALYVLLYSGVAGLLLTSAIALLIAAFVEQFELVVAITVIFALFYTVYLKRVLAQFEGFEDAPKIPDESKGDEESKDTAAHKGPTGVYDPKVDGFADVKETKDKKVMRRDGRVASWVTGTPRCPLNKVAREADLGGEVGAYTGRR